MHGAIRKGYGDSDIPVPEANVRTDPQALRETFAAPWQCSVTPLDTCGIVTLESDRYRKLRNSEDPALIALFENYDAWLRRVPWLEVKPDPRCQKFGSFRFSRCLYGPQRRIIANGKVADRCLRTTA